MLNLIIVDDDNGFLKSCENIKFNNCTKNLFNNPIDALEYIAENGTNIIVTDVQMPGVHGLQFSSIARKIVPNALIVVISANSLEQIKESVGEINHKKCSFFRKPLNEDFFNFLDNKIEELLKVKDQPEKINANFNLEKFDKVANLYIEYHDFMKKLAFEKKSFHYEEDWDKRKLLETKLSEGLNLLFEKNEIDSILKSLQDKYGSWEISVLKNKSKIIDNFNLKIDIPLNAEYDWNIDQKTISNIEFGYIDQDDCFLKINGKNITHNLAGCYTSKAGKIVYYANLINRITDKITYIKTGYLNTLRQLMLHKGLEKKLFEFSDPIKILSDEKEVEIINFTKDETGQFKVKNTNSEDINIQGFFSIKDIPDFFKMKSLNDFIEIGKTEITYCLNGSNGSIIYDELLDDYHKRGFNTEDCIQLKKNISINELIRVLNKI